MDSFSFGFSKSNFMLDKRNVVKYLSNVDQNKQKKLIVNE